MTDIKKGCSITEWNIKTRFLQEVKIEPTILVDVTRMTDKEIEELVDEVNKTSEEKINP